MNLKCIETINGSFNKSLFTKDTIYEFIPVDNRYTRVIKKEYNFVGYINKDDEGYKRWLSKDFKNKYFEEV